MNSSLFDKFLRLAIKKGECQMKRKNAENKFRLYILFLEYFFISFIGFCLCNVLSITIDCIFNGFAFWSSRILDLPFLFYLCASLVMSIVFIVVIKRRTR